MLHVLAGVMFLPFFVLALSMALRGEAWSDASVLTPSVILFWLSIGGWFCFVPMNVGRGNSEDKAVICTLYTMVAFMCAIVVTLFAFEESGSSGRKMVPMFVIAGPWLFLSVVLCVDGFSSRNLDLSNQVGCAGLVFIGVLLPR